MDIRIDKTQRLALLLDFYGSLLTTRQTEILDIYLNEDYSLSEIAEHLNVSRQAVYDAVKNGIAALEDFELKLGLVQQFTLRKEKSNSLRAAVLELEECIREYEIDAMMEKVNQIATQIDELFNYDNAFTEE